MDLLQGDICKQTTSTVLFKAARAFGCSHLSKENQKLLVSQYQSMICIGGFFNRLSPEVRSVTDRPIVWAEG
jgi:hypothetical protein